MSSKIQTHIFSCKAYKEIRIQAKSEGRARRVLKIKNPYGLYIYKGVRLNDSKKIDWNLLNN